MKNFTLFALGFCFLVFGCNTTRSEFIISSTETVPNDDATLGITGTSVSLINPDVAKAQITAPDTIKITSVSGGLAIIIVSDAKGHCAYIHLSVSETGTIKINNIEKYSAGAAQLNRTDLENDMFLPHEGLPAGVPDNYGWKKKPSSTLGINIPVGWNAILAWGQVYADETLPNPDKDFPLVRVQIKDLQLFIYQNNGTWKLIQDVMNPGGELYVEDFENDVHKPARIVHEDDGGISIQAGSGFNFHFYTSRETIINRNNIKGVLVLCQARLIGTENYTSPSKYLLSVGGDYWRDLTCQWKSDYSNNNDIAIGRFKYVTPEWQYFNMHTFKKSEVSNIIFPLE